MSEASSITVRSADGTSIGYELHGDGPGVILIDGAMCFRDSGPMRPLCTQLNADFTVLMYDRRGRGASSTFDRCSTCPLGATAEPNRAPGKPPCPFARRGPERPLCFQRARQDSNLRPAA